MVVVREQERVARYRMRSVYINGNCHVMRRSWPPEMLNNEQSIRAVVFLCSFHIEPIPWQNHRVFLPRFSGRTSGSKEGGPRLH